MLCPLPFSPLSQGSVAAEASCCIGGHGHHLVWQYCVGAATYETNLAEILPTVSFDSFDLRFIVGGYEPVPVQPELATVRHRIRDLDVHNFSALPVASPPGC